MHYTVLVIGPDYVKELEPFHSFESTGTESEYVQDIDKTEEALEGYRRDTQRVLRNPDGVCVDFYDERFYRELKGEEENLYGGTGTMGGVLFSSRDWSDGLGYRTKVHEIPEGWVEAERPISEEVSFEDWCRDEYGWEPLRFGQIRTEAHAYGFVEFDQKGKVIRCIDRTNPNAKWDWYRMGGRWSGFFPIKQGVSYSKDMLGEYSMEALNKRLADTCLVGEIDFKRAREEAESSARLKFSAWRDVFTKHGKPKSWSYFADKLNQAAKHIKPEDQRYYIGDVVSEYGLLKDKFKNEYLDQPAIMACDALCTEDPVDYFGFDEESFVKFKVDSVLVPFAVVKGGKWYSKDDIREDTLTRREVTEKWNKQVQGIYLDLPEDTRVTLVDFHI